MAMTALFSASDAEATASRIRSTNSTRLALKASCAAGLCSVWKCSTNRTTASNTAAPTVIQRMSLRPGFIVTLSSWRLGTRPGSGHSRPVAAQFSSERNIVFCQRRDNR